jgi:hypothetical protein
MNDEAMRRHRQNVACTAFFVAFLALILYVLTQ